MESTIYLALVSFLALFSHSVFASIKKENMLNVSVKLQLVGVLIDHIMKDTNCLLLKELKALKAALEIYETSFYDRKHMEQWCDDPTEMIFPNDILKAAYQRDSGCPFTEVYDLTEITELGPYCLKLTDLKHRPNYSKILNAIKTGSMRFDSLKYRFRLNNSNLRFQARKYILPHVTKLLVLKFEVQTGLRLTYKEIIEQYEIVPALTNSFNSYLTVPNAKDAFINLNCIHFALKTRYIECEMSHL